MALPGDANTTLQGGLSLASSSPGVHEPWYSEVNFVELTQNTTSDVLSIRRLHLFRGPGSPPDLNGWTEINLQSGVGTTGTLDTTTNKTFGDGATLRFKINDPRNLSNGLPAWTLLNMYGDADIDAYTDMAAFGPGYGVFPEMRCLSVLSVPSTQMMIYSAVTVGATTSLVTPPGVFQPGQRIRIQGLYLEPLVLGPLLMAVTNEIYFTRQ